MGENLLSNKLIVLAMIVVFLAISTGIVLLFEHRGSQNAHAAFPDPFRATAGESAEKAAY